MTSPGYQGPWLQGNHAGLSGTERKKYQIRMDPTLFSAFCFHGNKAGVAKSVISTAGRVTTWPSPSSSRPNGPGSFLLLRRWLTF